VTHLDIISISLFNPDVIDPSRIWPSLTGTTQMQPIIAQHSSGQTQQPTTQPQPQPQKFSNFPLQMGSSAHQVSMLLKVHIPGNLGKKASVKFPIQF
jgi:hypothetical protein